MLILLHGTAFAAIIVHIWNHKVAVSIHRKVDWGAHFRNRVLHVDIHTHLLDLLSSSQILHIFNLLELISQLNLILLNLVFHIQNVLVIIFFINFILA